MNILLAVDNRPSSRSAAQAVATRPWPEGSIVRVFTVVESVNLPTREIMMQGGDLKEIERHRTAEAEQLVGEVAASLQGSLGSGDVRVETAVRKGSFRETIVEEATDWPADLIVTASHEEAGLKRLIAGSPDQWLTSHAPCSLELVRDRPADRHLAA